MSETVLHISTPVRLSLALAGAVAVTLSLCLLAPLLGGSTATTGSTSSLPIHVIPAVPPATVPNKHIPVPQKMPLPVPQKKILQTTTPRVKTPTINLAPLTVKIPHMNVATLPTPLPTPRPGTMQPGPTIHDLKAVDTPPQLQRYSPPPYPPKAKGRRIEGKVVVRCVVGANGRVHEAKILTASPAGFFEAVSLKTVQKWTFVPAVLDGDQVAVYVDIPLSYTLNR